MVRGCIGEMDSRTDSQHLHTNSEKLQHNLSSRSKLPKEYTIINVLYHVSLQIVRKARSETCERTKRTVSSSASACKEGGWPFAGLRMEFTGETECSCQTTTCSRSGVLPTPAGN